MNLSSVRRASAIGVLVAATFLLAGCPQENREVKSTSGVSQTSVKVETDANGNTIEQRNVMRRLNEDNKPGAVKHFYVIAPESGQTILYSTVDGKVTSSGKRLAPRTVAAQDGEMVSGELGGIPVKIGDFTRRTSEVLEDDGTYGDSVPYIYWWDTRGIFHQHFFTGGQIMHVSSEPVSTRSVILNLEVQQAKPAQPGK